MKVIHYIILGLSAILGAACSIDEIAVFEENNFISFDIEENETGIPQLSYTFTFLEESVRETVYEIPVVYAGRYRNDAVPFAWEVMTDSSTAVLNTHYQLLDEKEQVIAAGKNNGVAKIKLLRTDDMQSDSYELVLRLIENEYFKTGSIEQVKIVITDQLVKPDYWDSYYDRYLKDYSAMKFRLWLEFNNINDGSNPFDTDQYIVWTDRGTGNFIYKNYKESEIKTTVLEFRQWLYKEKNNPYDEELEGYVAEMLGDF